MDLGATSTAASSEKLNKNERVIRLQDTLRAVLETLTKLRPDEWERIEAAKSIAAIRSALPGTAGERLKDLIEAHHLTQAEIAKGTGLSIGTISNYINDKNGGILAAKASAVIALSKYFGVSVEWLLGQTNYNNPTRDEVLKEISQFTGLSSLAIERFRGADKKLRDAVCYVWENSGLYEPDSLLWSLTLAIYAAGAGAKGVASLSSPGASGELQLGAADLTDFYIQQAARRFAELMWKYVKEYVMNEEG